VSTKWEIILSIVTVVAGVVLLVTDAERDLGIILVSGGVGARAGSFTRGRAEANQ
jgi:hypothetical protein